jgi:hypothetical protein
MLSSLAECRAEWREGQDRARAEIQKTLEVQFKLFGSALEQAGKASSGECGKCRVYEKTAEQLGAAVQSWKDRSGQDSVRAQKCEAELLREQQAGKEEQAASKRVRSKWEQERVEWESCVARLRKDLAKAYEEVTALKACCEVLENREAEEREKGERYHRERRREQREREGTSRIGGSTGRSESGKGDSMGDNRRKRISGVPGGKSQSLASAFVFGQKRSR